MLQVMTKVRCFVSSCDTENELFLSAENLHCSRRPESKENSVRAGEPQQVPGDGQGCLHRYLHTQSTSKLFSIYYSLFRVCFELLILLLYLL